MGQNPGTPVVHIKIAGKWMFIPLKMVLIGIDPYPYHFIMFWGLGLQTTPNEDFTSGFFGSTASRRAKIPCLGSGFESMGFFGTFQLLGLSP